MEVGCDCGREEFQDGGEGKSDQIVNREIVKLLMYHTSRPHPLLWGAGDGECDEVSDDLLFAMETDELGEITGPLDHRGASRDVIPHQRDVRDRPQQAYANRCETSSC